MCPAGDGSGQCFGRRRVGGERFSPHRCETDRAVGGELSLGFRLGCFAAQDRFKVTAPAKNVGYPDRPVFDEITDNRGTLERDGTQAGRQVVP